MPGRLSLSGHQRPPTAILLIEENILMCSQASLIINGDIRSWENVSMFFFFFVQTIIYLVLAGLVLIYLGSYLHVEPWMGTLPNNIHKAFNIISIDATDGCMRYNGMGKKRENAGSPGGK